MLKLTTVVLLLTILIHALVVDAVLDDHHKSDRHDHEKVHKTVGHEKVHEIDGHKKVHEIDGHEKVHEIDGHEKSQKTDGHEKGQKTTKGHEKVYEIDGHEKGQKTDGHEKVHKTDGHEKVHKTDGHEKVHKIDGHDKVRKTDGHGDKTAHHPKNVVATKPQELDCDTKHKTTINPLCYPQPIRDDDVVDDYHGTKVPDPYRDLEDPDAEKTAEFVKQLNAVSRPFLEHSPAREQIRAKWVLALFDQRPSWHFWTFDSAPSKSNSYATRGDFSKNGRLEIIAQIYAFVWLEGKYEKLFNYEKIGITSKQGPYYYFSRNTGLQNQAVIFQQKSLDDDEGTVFMDPNTFSEDGTTALALEAFTEDGTIYAYGISEKGSDWITVKFKSVDGEYIPDVIPDVKFSSLTWLHDNSGLFYSKYPGVTSESKTEKLEFHSLFFHRMGTDAKEDILVVERTDVPDMNISAYISDDGRFLFINQSNDFANNELYIYDLAKPIIEKIKPNPLFDKRDASYSVVDSDEHSALIQTNHEASMNKLVRIKLAGKANQNDEWEEVIEEDPDRKLEWALPVHGTKLIVCYTEDVKNTLYVHDLQSGTRLYQIPLEIGTVDGVWGRKHSAELFISFSSFLVPTIVYHGDFGNVPKNGDGKVQLREIKRTNVAGLESHQFEVKQVFYPSKDGTKIPMYIYHVKDLHFDGSHGTLLYGYGGFNSAEMPYFSVSRLMWAKHFGGVMAIANIRGGSEYGEKWHEAGMLENKQNVFDDFIAAAEFLIHEKYTNPKRLAIQGGSNGGLLTAVCSQQRPDLFGAVLTEVGVLDMLRFNEFTAGTGWVTEYGNPKDPAHFPFIFKYSPLHNLAIEQDQQWPFTLLMSADHDDRVVPMHTLKYTAQLYHLLATEAWEWQRNPVLARIEENAGHGAGKPTSKIIDEIVDIYCFLQRALDLTWNEDGVAHSASGGTGKKSPKSSKNAHKYHVGAI